MQLHELACSSFLRLSSSQEFRSACLPEHSFMLKSCGWKWAGGYVVVGGPLDYTVISWVWGNLSISHPQSQSQLLVNIDITCNKCNILNRSTRLIWNRMKEFEDVAQGDWGQGGVVTEYLRTPGVGHVTDCAAGNTAEAPGTWVTTFTPTLDRLAWAPWE